MRITQISCALAALFCFSCAAFADANSVKKSLQAKFPEVPIEKVTKTPYAGLYEVVAGSDVFYADEKGDYLFVGNVIDAKTRQNLTEERIREVTAIAFDSLPLDLAVKTVRGNGKRKVAVFSDPDCPFCKRLERDLINITDVTIYTFLYPIESLHPDAAEKAKAVWCAPDRSKAWLDLMLKDVQPPAAKCEAPLDRVAELRPHLGPRLLVEPDPPDRMLRDDERGCGRRPR